MSQLVLDDQLDLDDVLPGLQSWITWERLQALRPTEQILDERVPGLLLTLKRPTFITIDHGFWHRGLCHSGYCILYFALTKEEQEKIPTLLRRVLHLPEFQTRAARMGKVARVQKQAVTYWKTGARTVLKLPEKA